MTWVLVVWLLVPDTGWRMEIRGEYPTDTACRAAATREQQEDLPEGIDNRAVACVDKATLPQ